MQRRRRRRQCSSPCSDRHAQHLQTSHELTASTGWEKVMKTELSSLDDYEAADLVPFEFVPAGHSIIGKRWVYRIKTDGRFKARVLVQGWA